MDERKMKIGELALQKGIINDPNWLEKLDDSMPVWAVLEMLLGVMEKLETNYSSYD
ncbi:hypothetical protein PAESOLCIP111_01347 [Paenibacillus solanacearum]|uniref:Uncharacterized protein n=1 Tax=Paenibacillus solanacearum TaxID=2048548 RepID=A0A916NHN4_9BACL|nr:hypothetical protein [Paenibacillus solanacearum]CAG7611223.1 hypothetical protein PAESOLCIP111_01347 [Paenibacillus solanacearum]